MIYIITKPNIAQSVLMYPGTWSGDRDHGSRESIWIYMTSIPYPLFVSPCTIAECLETQLVLMYRVHVRQVGARGHLQELPPPLPPRKVHFGKLWVIFIDSWTALSLKKSMPILMSSCFRTVILCYFIASKATWCQPVNPWSLPCLPILAHPDLVL